MSARLAPTSVRRPENPRRRHTRRLQWGAGALAVLLAVTVVSGLDGVGGPDDGGRERRTGATLAASGTNPVTPGDFTGYGFDQCLTPSQASMDAWLEHSPFLAVGVYTSGNSRFCRNQPNLTPSWVSTQLRRGWRILPITLGPQSTCVGRFPRYGASIDPTISNNASDDHAAARAQGRDEATTAVAAAQALGIVPRSTLWYDLEGWSDYTNATCRESALAFLKAWTNRIHKLGYVSGVYSSAGSGMKILDDARAQGRTDVELPDQVWIARWDGVANTSTSYLREDGWRPGGRMKQYRGGHDETWGTVRINIDSNYLDLGDSTPAPESHCGGVRVDRLGYPTLKKGTRGHRRGAVKALQCLLREKKVYDGAINGWYGLRTQKAVVAWQRKRGFSPTTTWSSRHWIGLLAQGRKPVLKTGSRGLYVRRAQRAIQAALPELRISIDGVFDREMAADVKAYRRAVGQKNGARYAGGVVNRETWRRLQAGQG